MRRLLVILLVVVGLGLLLGFVVYVVQDAMVFPGAGRAPRPVTAPGVRDIELTGPSGPFRVAEAVPAEPVAVIVFFVGNGEDLQSAGYRAAMFAAHGLAAVCPEYPGYGGSAGEPGVESLFAAARVAAEHAAGLARERGIPLVAGGISLGTFCAVHVAAAGLVERLLLAAPLSSLHDAAAAHYGWLPLRWLLRHRFDSMAAAPRIRCPVLIVHGERDRVVPIELGERLYAALPGEKELVRVPGVGHNDLPLAPGTAIGARIGRFLRGR